MDLNSCLTRLCNGFVSYPNPYEMVKRGFYTRRANNNSICLEKAGEGGYFDLINFYLFRNDGEGINNILYGAAKGGHLYMMKELENLGIQNWNEGIYGAIDGEHLHILKFLEDKRVIYSESMWISIWTGRAQDVGDPQILNFLRDLKLNQKTTSKKG